MSATTTISNFKRIKKLRADNFDLQKLSSYSLCLQIGINDLQFCVINKQTNRCLVIEDFKLENIKTTNSRLEVIKTIMSKHPFLKSRKWDDIKVSFKTHKFSLVPANYFVPEAASDYLVLNSQIKTKIDQVYYYKHISSSAVNIFTADKKVISWLKSIYPQKSIQIIHQGTALLEGILSYDDHSHEKSMFCLLDRGILHIAVTQRQSLLFYNQFVTRTSEEVLKYIMLIFKEIGLSPKSNKLVLWGLLKNDGPPLTLLKKYIRNISLGSKPNFLKFPDNFTELPEHRYFDLFSIFLCE